MLVVGLKLKLLRYPLLEGLPTSETGVFAFLLHPDPSVWLENIHFVQLLQPRATQHNQRVVLLLPALQPLPPNIIC